MASALVLVGPAACSALVFTDADADGDGYRSAAEGGRDCDDADPEVHPGAIEVWRDGVDQDCDGRDDDEDGDGVRGDLDCDDADPLLGEVVRAGGLGAGDLVITEFMASPASGSCEWFEVLPLLDACVDFAGLEVTDATRLPEETTPLQGEELLVRPGQRAVLARSYAGCRVARADPSAPLFWLDSAGYLLEDDGDQVLVLGHGGEEVVRLHYSGETFPSPEADVKASIAADEGLLSDDPWFTGTGWFVSTAAMDDGASGTPGAANTDGEAQGDERPESIDLRGEGIVVTEVSSEDDWFEVANLGPPVDLIGLVVYSTDANQTKVVTESAELGTDGRAVLAAGAVEGCEDDCLQVELDSLMLNNRDPDAIYLASAQGDLDRFDYDPTTLLGMADAEGRIGTQGSGGVVALDPNAPDCLDARANDEPGCWCAAEPTPGAANACAE